MSEWSDEREEPPPWDWDGVKQKVLIGAGCVAAIVAWMVFARPGEELPSSRGFNLGGGEGGSSGATGRPFATRGPKTSLDMVSSAIGGGPAGVTPGLLPGGAAAEPSAAAEPPPAAASAPAPAAAAAVTAPPQPAAAAAPPAPPPAADEAKDAAAAGVPTDAKGLNRLGAQEGLLSALAAKVMGHPAALRYLLNNKTVVDAYFSRDLVKKNCSSGSALKSYLMDSSNPQGVTEELSIARMMLRSPAAASAALGSEFGKRMMDCPSVGQVAKDPGAAMMIVGSNPALMTMLSDPNAMKTLNSNPQAASLFGAAQSGLGGGK